MKFTLSIPILALTLASTLAAPSPVRRDTVPTDQDILNYALTLEHLENAFYSGALSKFTEQDFVNDGLPTWAYGRFKQVGSHEATHVAFLESVLGANATKPCTYDFPYTTPKEFTALSQALEGVGVSAYSGAAQYITSKEYLTAAAVVLSTEARHASWVAGAVNQLEPWSGALDVPLGLNEVFSLAAAFITSCPTTNPVLPVKAFPKLALTLEGTSGTVSYNGSSSAGDTFVAFYVGLSTLFAPVSGGKFTLPAGVIGTSYAVISTNGTVVSEASTIAGPAIVEIDFDSNVA